MSLLDKCLPSPYLCAILLQSVKIVCARTNHRTNELRLVLMHHSFCANVLTDYSGKKNVQPKERNTILIWRMQTLMPRQRMMMRPTTSSSAACRCPRWLWTMVWSMHTPNWPVHSEILSQTKMTLLPLMAGPSHRFDVSFKCINLLGFHALMAAGQLLPGLLTLYRMTLHQH